MINPCNNTLLNERERVFGPAKGVDFQIQCLFTGYMLRFDGGTVQEQMGPAINDNDQTRAEFRQALKILPESFPALLKTWQGAKA